MKNKKLSFDILSNKKCEICGKQIKQRLIDTKNHISLCYKHWKEKEAKRNHNIDCKARQKRIQAGLPVKNYLN